MAAIPQNFEVSPAWVALVEKSSDVHGATWLHHLYLGTARLEAFNASAARLHFESSLAMEPNVHSARNLAVMSSEELGRWDTLKGASLYDRVIFTLIM